jgi:hypothetical protein
MSSAHGEMNGMFIPPSFSITQELITGKLWTKRLIGETIHARRKTMSNHLHKFLMTEDMFSKDCQDEYREIVRASRGDGYVALHKIMRMYRPRLTERRVETKYPSHSVTARFTQHAKDVQEYIDREAVRGRLYSRYDSLQLVIATLHLSYHMKLKQLCERELRHDHSMEEDLSFKLQMPQLGTSLTTWADELKLCDRRPARVSHVALQEIEESATLVHAIGQLGPCYLFDGPHTETSCHKFINHIMGEKFLREKEVIVKQIKREYTTFIKPRSMVGPRTSTVRLIEAPLVSLDQNPEIDSDEPSMAAAATSQLTLVVNSHVAAQAVHDDDDDSCASFETHSEEIDFVRVINFDDFDPSLGAAYDMDLLDSVNVNTSGKASAQIPQLPLGDNSPPWGR